MQSKLDIVLNAVTKGLKDGLAQARRDVSGFASDVSEEFKTLNASMEKTGDTLGKIQGFKELRRDLESTRKAYAQAREKVGSLAREMNSGEKATRETKSAFNEARREARQLKKSLEEKQVALHRLRQELKGAGVSTVALQKHEKELEQALADAKRKLDDLARSAARSDRMSAALNRSLNEMRVKVRRAFTDIQNNARNLTRQLFSIQSLLLGLGAGYVAKGFIDTADAFEQMEAKLDQLTRGRGAETLKELNDWAMEMPVNTKQAVEAYVQMVAMGLDPTIEKMQVLTDVAVVMGEDAFPRVARALGQMQANSKLSAEELNQLAEVGINARKYLTKAFGMTVEELQKSGMEIDRIIDAIWEGLAGDFGGSAARAQDKWRGMTTQLVSYWTEMEKSVMDAGLFEYMKNGLRAVLDHIRELKENGTLKDWARKISDAVIETFEKLLLGAASLADALKTPLIEIWDTIKSMWDGFKQLPDWVKEIGIVGAVLGGKKGKALFVLVSMGADALGDFSKALDAYQKGYISLAEWAASDDEAIERLLKERGHWEEIANLAADPGNLREIETGGAQSATAFVKAVIARLREERPNIREEINKALVGGSANGGSKGILPAISDEARSESQMARLKAASQTALAELETVYDRGEIGLRDYFTRRRELLQKEYREETAMIKKMAAAETDPAQKLRLEDQLFQKEETHKRALIRLAGEQAQAEKRLADSRRQARDLLDQMRGRIQSTETAGDLAAQFQMEQGEMDRRHAEEIERLREHLTAKEELEEAHRLQKLEKDRLLLDQDRRIWETNVQNIRQIAAGAADIFQNLYELSGKKHKEFFYLAKAAALAEAIVNTSLAITKALAEGGPFAGPALAAVAAANGAVQIARITAQQLAAGGPVRGYSPSDTADNVPIMATAGEFMQPVPAVRYYGTRVMEAIRRRLIPRELFAGLALPDIRPSYSFALAAGGGVPSMPRAAGEPPAVRIMNVFDPDLVKDYLSTPDGERLIVNIMRRKSDYLR